MKLTDEEIEKARDVVRNADSKRRKKIYDFCMWYVDKAFEGFADPDKKNETFTILVSDRVSSEAEENGTTLVVFIHDILSVHFDATLQGDGGISVREKEADQMLKEALQVHLGLREKLRELSELLATYPVSNSSLDLVRQDLWNRLEPYKNKRGNYDKK